MLYSEVEISREPIPYPQYVRRIVLPYTSTSYDSHPDPSAVVDHLRQCAQVEILSRPPEGRLEKRFTRPATFAGGIVSLYVRSSMETHFRFNHGRGKEHCPRLGREESRNLSRRTAADVRFAGNMLFYSTKERIRKNIHHPSNINQEEHENA